MTGQIKVIVGLLLFCGVAAASAMFGERAIAERAEQDAILAEATQKAKAAEEASAVGAKATAHRKAASPEKGKELYTSFGCIGCHSFDGSMRVGPSFLNMYGRTEKLTDGSQVKVDEDYIRESLMSPNAKVVAGYVPTMPSFSGKVEQDDLDNLVAWFKTLH